jgi:mRNA interferase MazF
MITTTAHHAWSGDVEIRDTAAAGLPLPCIVRLKLFTLDARLLLKRIGALSASDRRRVASVLKAHLF